MRECARRHEDRSSDALHFLIPSERIGELVNSQEESLMKLMILNISHIQLAFVGYLFKCKSSHIEVACQLCRETCK